MKRRNAYVGSAVERIEDDRFLRGAGQYVGDLRSDGMLHAAILRSPHAHGRIRAIETAAARALPGVIAVLSARDLGPNIPTVPLRQDILPALARFEQPVIAHGKVRYVGEPVAVVIAESAALAEDALEAIQLDIDPLPPVADRDASRRDEILLFEETGSNCASRFTAMLGDADAAFRTADYTRREHFSVHRHTAIPMEPRGLVAEWDSERGKLTVCGAAKVPFFNRRTLARQLGLAESAVDFIENDVGGGFGVRGEFYPEDFLIPFAARHLGRPVRWIEDRREHFLATNHARDAECDIEIACRSDGTILALRGQIHTDIGAYVRTNGATASRNVAQVFSGPYRIPGLRIDVSLQLTNKTPAGTYRAPGRFEADYFRERLLDIVAGELGLDRVELRRRNLIAQSDMPYALARILPFDGEAACDSGDYCTTLDRCLAEIDWPQKSRLNGRLIDGRYHGLGLGCYIEGGGAGPKENVRIDLAPDGAVTVVAGSSALGQGLETTLAQIAADALELPIERIRVLHGSTSLLPEGFGSYGSRSAVMGGSAILAAASALRAKIRDAAALSLACTPEEITLVEEGVTRASDNRRVGYAELDLPPLSAAGSFASTKRTYSYGAHAAHVAVDPRTGAVELIDYVAVEDVGRIINPLTLHGQTLGAIVQGLGGVFLEQLCYDDEAQLMTASFADYLLPTAGDFPEIHVVAMELHPSPHNPLGAKGAGEGGMIPVGGVIANAVAAALAPLGVQLRDLPLSPPRVWEMIAAAKRDARAV
jgi:carbon-monoxide dehydrogenase large subunit